ncbi:MAG: efflux RND transporter periplasmic adaptor subunit [Myxococcales bacterium]|nr:efflux RND transporter periplasmic adaptor subunit [Myxococcales bacterium]
MTCADRRWRLALVLGVVAGCARPEADEAGEEAPASPIPFVSVAPVEAADAIEHKVFFGRIEARTDTALTLGAPYDCRVVTLSARVDEVVAPGAALVAIEPVPQARQELDAARTELDVARERLGALQELFDNKLLTKEALREAQGAVAQARTHVATLRRTGIEPRALSADQRARVTEVAVEPGGIYTMGTALLKLRPTGDALEAVIGLTPADAAPLEAGGSLTVSAVDGSFADLQGSVRLVAARVDAQTGLVAVRLRLAAGGSRTPLGEEIPAFEGQAVRAVLATAPAPSLLVPHAALVRREDQLVVFRVDAERQVHETPVTVRFEEGGRAALEPTAGLGGGDNIVVVGGYPLADGMTVEIARAP